ncbi:hypothetical protein BTJ44_00366 [Bacillus mycoides]|nr:hypothetical protein BTJ44_00366 [Bacillus mycoides]OSY05720.1 hypothetical protein BTJ48_03958 [Bacillus mycoides]
MKIEVYGEEISLAEDNFWFRSLAKTCCRNWTAAALNL